MKYFLCLLLYLTRNVPFLLFFNICLASSLDLSPTLKLDSRAKGIIVPDHIYTLDNSNAMFKSKLTWILLCLWVGVLWCLPLLVDVLHLEAVDVVVALAVDAVDGGDDLAAQVAVALRTLEVVLLPVLPAHRVLELFPPVLLSILPPVARSRDQKIKITHL